MKWLIKVKSLPLFLHKSSNMFTTDVRQARRYKTSLGAKKWIEDKSCADKSDDYNFRFSGLEFVLVGEDDGDIENEA